MLQPAASPTCDFSVELVVGERLTAILSSLKYALHAQQTHNVPIALPHTKGSVLVQPNAANDTDGTAPLTHYLAIEPEPTFCPAAGDDTGRTRLTLSCEDGVRWCGSQTTSQICVPTWKPLSACENRTFSGDQLGIALEAGLAFLRAQRNVTAPHVLQLGEPYWYSNASPHPSKHSMGLSQPLLLRYLNP